MSGGWRCPVCGFGMLLEEPWTAESPSDEICPCCGVQFGYDDHRLDPADRATRHDELRRRWQARGMPWFSRSRPAPLGWSPTEQLRALDG